MKKIFLIAAIFFLLMTNTSFAALENGSDGLSYWNGNPYLLLIDSGSAFGTLADLAKIRVTYNKSNGIEFTVNTFTVNYKSGVVSHNKAWTFYEDYRTGDIYANGRKWIGDSDTSYQVQSKFKKFNKMKNIALGH